MAMPVHIVLIDTTGTIRFSRMEKVAAAIEHQMKHDLGKFYDVDARITRATARRGASQQDLARAHRAGRAGGGGFHSDQEGAPFAKVCIGPHWTMSVSHEIIEMVFDPTGSRLHTAPAIHLVNGQVETTRRRVPLPDGDLRSLRECGFRLQDRRRGGVGLLHAGLLRPASEALACATASTAASPRRARCRRAAICAGSIPRSTRCRCCATSIAIRSRASTRSIRPPPQAEVTARVRRRQAQQHAPSRRRVVGASDLSRRPITRAADRRPIVTRQFDRPSWPDRPPDHP